MQSRDLPDRAMKQRIVSNLINGGIRPIEFCPGHSLKSKGTHLNLFVQRLVPLTLVSPQRNLSETGKSGQYAGGVMRDIGFRRRQGREPIEFHNVTQAVSLRWPRKGAAAHFYLPCAATTSTQANSLRYASSLCTT